MIKEEEQEESCVPHKVRMLSFYVMEDKSEKCHALNSFPVQVKFPMSYVCVCPDAFQAELGPVFWIAFSVSLARIKAVGATGGMRKHQY